MSYQIMTRLLTLVYFVAAGRAYIEGCYGAVWFGRWPVVAGLLALAAATAIAGVGLWGSKTWGWVVGWVAWALWLLALGVREGLLPSWEFSMSLSALADSAIAGPPSLAVVALLAIAVGLWFTRPSRRPAASPAAAGSQPAVPIWRRLLMGLGMGLTLIAPAWAVWPARPVPLIRESPVPGGRPLRVLFIGNSLTHFIGNNRLDFMNDVPGLLMALGAADNPPQPISTGMVVEGGASLYLHAWQGVAADVIQHQGPWDFVVLQEQSYTSAFFPEVMQRDVRWFDSVIRSVGAKTVIFAANPQMKTFAALGRELPAAVVPVRIVWEEALRAQPDLELFGPDGAHPGPAGSYLAACTLYAVLCGHNPQGLPARLCDSSGQPLVDLAPAQARLLQAVAQRVAQGYQGGEIPSLHADVTLLKFFEMGEEWPPVAERAYTNRFEKSRSRRIAWELHLEHPPPGQRVDFALDAVFYHSDGRVFGKQTTQCSLEADWRYSFWSNGWGWPQPGTWPAGSYRVELSVQGKKVASNSFEVYEKGRSP